MKKGRRKHSYDFEINIYGGFIFVICAILVLIYYQANQNNNDIVPFSFPQPIHFPPIYFAVMVSDPKKLNASILSYQKWGKYLSLYSPGSKLVFYSQKELPYDQLKNITHIYEPLKAPYGQGSLGFSRLSGFIRALDDFLQNSSSQWLFRTTDTAFINLKMFSRYITYLESIFTPDGNMLMKGELKYMYNSFYLEGNAGFLISREACKYTLAQTKDLRSLSDPRMNDDFLISEFWEELPFDTMVYSSKAILGTRISPKTIGRIRDRVYSGLPKCSENDQYTRVKDIAVWASSDDNMTALLYGNDFIESAPDYLFFKVNSRSMISLCVDGEMPNPAWMDYEPYLS